MQEALISILLPVRNAETTIKAAIDSILNQSFANWELIVINDGSTDQTPEILHKYSTDKSKIRVINTKAQGISKALNLGLKASKGNFIARMDADDISFPHRLEKQVQFLLQNPSYDLVSCKVSYGGATKETHGYKLYVDWINSILEHEEILKNRFIESPLSHPSVLFRKSICENNMWKDGDFPEDYELWLRLLESGVKMSKIPEELLLWNDSKSRLSRTDNRYSNEAFYQLKSEYLARHIKQEHPEQKVWIWGAGKESKKRALQLEKVAIKIHGWIDVDSNKVNKEIKGSKVQYYKDLPKKEDSIILSYVGNRNARLQIKNYLKEQGWEESKDFILCT